MKAHDLRNIEDKIEELICELTDLKLEVIKIRKNTLENRNNELL